MKQFIIIIGMAMLSVACTDQSIEPMENISNDIISRSMNPYSESTSNPTLATDWEIWKKSLIIEDGVLLLPGI